MCVCVGRGGREGGMRMGQRNEHGAEVTRVGEGYENGAEVTRVGQRYIAGTEV